MLKRALRLGIISNRIPRSSIAYGNDRRDPHI